MTRCLLALLLAPLVGCSAFGLAGAGSKALDIDPPKVSIAAVRLAELPSNRDLASYYCAQYLGPLICRAFGPVPSVEDIHFAFDVELEMQNSSSVPLPLVQTLVAFTAFPEAENVRNLGTVCLSFCEDASHCKQDADACTSDEPEIRDVRDFANATAGFLVATALGESSFRDLRVRTIPANERLRMVVRLGLDPLQMLDLLRELGKGEFDRIKQGQVPEFTIPYEIEGTAWVSVQSLGRLATGFGPAAGQWRLQR